MKRRALIIFITILFILCIPIFLLVCGFGLPAQYGETFLGELKYKVQRLDETEGKRIILLGGSGVAFGFDCSVIEWELPQYKAVNFGMYAALGTKIMLDLSEPSVKRGDIVIISPEQNAQTLSDYFNAEMFWQGADGAYSLLRRVKSENMSAVVGQFPAFAARKCSYAFSGVPSVEGIYRRSSFNEYGDIAAVERGYNIMSGLYDATMPVYYDESVADESFFEMCNRYAAKMRARGATVYYRFCPANRLAVTGDIDAYFDFLQSKLEFPIIGNPNESVMDAEWFYDTNFHLNASGALLNTRNFVRDMKAVLGDSSPTTTPVPEKPQIPEQDEFWGDDSHVGYFEYEAWNNGWRIVGLNDAGKMQHSLTLPTHYDGKPVLIVGARAFASGSVREITIQANITAIEDEAFAGCKALNRIVLQQPNPSRCQVGQNLLGGTQANLFVPADALGQYRLNYFWAPYASRIFAVGEN